MNMTPETRAMFRDYRKRTKKTQSKSTLDHVTEIMALVGMFAIVLLITT